MPNRWSAANLPDLYLFATRSVGASPADCIVIEDSTLGLRSAVAAGMGGFVGAGHATPELANQLEMSGAPKVIASMSDLPSTIEEIVEACT